MGGVYSIILASGGEKDYFVFHFFIIQNGNFISKW